MLKTEETLEANINLNFSGRLKEIEKTLDPHSDASISVKNKISEITSLIKEEKFDILKETKPDGFDFHIPSFLSYFKIQMSVDIKETIQGFTIEWQKIQELIKKIIVDFWYCPKGYRF